MLYRLSIFGLVMLLAGLNGCASVAPTAPAAPPPTSAAVGQTTLVAIQAPAPPPGGGLGIGRAIKGIGAGLRRIGQGIRNRLGMRFPGLESKPPLTAITDPANSSPDADPAAQAAAEIKAAEDGADQKVKSLRYLATIGCSGCYPGVEEAFLSALEDCTERVRYEAVKALRSNGGSPCEVCASGNCCSEKLLKKLHELGNERNEKGFVEPSARVRRTARIAVSNCGGYVATVGAEESSSFPTEGPPNVVEDAPAADSPAPAPVPETLPAPAPTPEQTGQHRRPNSSHVQLVDFRMVIPESKVVVARVDGDAILESELLLQYVMENPQLPVPHTVGDLPSTFVRGAIEKSVRRKLLAHAAEKRLSAEQLATLISQSFVEGPIDPIEREQVLAEAWLKQARPADTNEISFAAIKRRFDAEYGEQMTPAQSRWEQISVRKSDFPSRTAAFESIEHARRRALGVDGPPPTGFQPSRIQFVVRSWTSLDRVTPLHRQVLEHLQPGAVSRVVEDGERLYVFRLLQRKAPRKVTLEEVRPALVASIKQAAASQFERVYVDQLRRQAEVWSLYEN